MNTMTFDEFIERYPHLPLTLLDQMVGVAEYMGMLDDLKLRLEERWQ